MPKIVHMTLKDIAAGTYNHVSNIRQLLQADTAYILPVGKGKCCIYTIDKKDNGLSAVWSGWDRKCPFVEYEDRTLYLLPYQRKQRVDPLYCFKADIYNVAGMLHALYPDLHIHVGYGVGNSTTRKY